MNNGAATMKNSIKFGADGRLLNLNDWSPELAEEMARNEGLTLTDQHWDVINTIREYYQAFNISPIYKLLRRELKKKFGAERASDEALSSLFPAGVQHQSSRLAGVPLAFLDAELEHSGSGRSVQPVSSDAKPSSNQVDFNGKTVLLYPSGNLVNLQDWNEDLAGILAEKEGIHLTDEHWVVLNFLRKFYFEFGVAPMVNILIKYMSEELGPEAANRDILYTLFPDGPAKQGSRIAGLPSPQGCIDG